ncbi:ArsR/SmtB family transcription factor [Nonomuraea sp. NPDC050556]|uniref:ArsR/SmtB family transcription factor n=1 Tax=Nonomuraea sp. NPDC050556 TaxID=3364369 RepID=UPI0037AA5E8F
MQRIHFTSDDLCRVRLADGPDPLWEMTLAANLLCNNYATLVFGAWKQLARRAMPRSVEMFWRLAPPVGYIADFVTPSAGALDLTAGVDAVLSTGTARLTTDLGRLDEERPLPSWARSLADGELDTVRRLGGELRAFHDAAVQPYWARIQSDVQADRAQRLRALAAGGTEALLSSLHPRITWQPPVLTIEYLTDTVPDRDMYLDGRGLVILPSFFCFPGPLTLRDPELPPVLVCPIEHELGWADRGIEERSLTALLGRTRAAVLESVATGQARSTTQLARLLSISLASASQHVAVLREAGLVASHRRGKEVVHCATGLGADLLNGPRPADRVTRTPR